MDPRVVAYFALTTLNTVAEILLNDEKFFFTTVLLLKCIVLVTILKFPEFKFNQHLVAIAMSPTVGFWIHRSPRVWESDLWCVMTDTVMITWLLLTDECNVKDASVPCATLREQFAAFYLASGVFKLNADFMTPDTSCGTLFAAQHVAYFLGNWCSMDTLAAIFRMIKPLAPSLTVGVEIAMGALLLAGSIWSSRRLTNWGLLVIFYFHLAVCLTPRPLDISNFGLMCGVRLVALLDPNSLRRAVEQIRPFCIPLVLTALGTIAWGRRNNFTPLNWAFAMFVPVLIFHQIAISSVPSIKQVVGDDCDEGKAISKLRRPAWTKAASAFAFFYAFGHLILGLQEESTCNMFSSLSVHGGSNHYFLPTGLLFYFFRNSPDSHPFGGGIIRIESTTSHWLTTIYPADLSHVLEPTDTLVPLLNAAKQSPADSTTTTPVYFSPGANRVLRLIERGWVPHAGTFLQYTVPALEMKRLLREAMERDGSFRLVYAKLAGVSGDAVWRATSVEKRVRMQVKDGAITSCKIGLYSGSKLKNTTSCSPSDLPYQLDVPFWIRKISVYFGYAILYDSQGQPRKGTPCVD